MITSSANAEAANFDNITLRWTHNSHILKHNHITLTIHNIVYQQIDNKQQIMIFTIS